MIVRPEHLDRLLCSHQHQSLANSLLRSVEELAGAGQKEDLEYLAYRVTKAANHVLYMLSENAQQHRQQAEDQRIRLEQELNQAIFQRTPMYAG